MVTELEPKRNVWYYVAMGLIIGYTALIALTVISIIVRAIIHG